MRRLALTVMVSVFAAACSEVEQPTALPLDAAFAPQADSPLQDVIVVFNEDVSDPQGLAQGLVAGSGGSIGHVYGTGLRGFSASLPAEALAGIQNNPNVSFVEPDGVATATITTEVAASWGIDRIDSPTSTDGFYNYNFDGTGVTVYVLDTGIRITHNDFGGRASHGRDFVDDDDISEDCGGHGTHVAGTVGGATYGVAKNVNLVAVRVLNCAGSGSYSDVIAAIDWVNARSGARVINMSLSGPTSAAVNAAVNSSVAAGVVHAVAAGNDNWPACNNSPASAADALTAGSTTSSDNRSGFSNFGTCLDLFAPGSLIISTDYSSNTATSTKSGTSMASPHVAGAAALYMQENPGATALQVNAGIIGNATPGEVGSPGTGSPNLMLYSLFGAPPPPPPPPPPALDVQIESHTVIAASANGNRKRGVSTVRIVEMGTTQGVAGVTVSGQWSQDYNGSGSGVTNSNGTVTIQTPNLRRASAFTFCVNSLMGSTINNQTGLNNCASSGGSPPPPPPPPPPSGAPDNLSVVWKTKGKARADLSWTGGASSVDVIENGTSRTTISNSQSYRDNSPGNSYQVCTVGESIPEQCTDVVNRP